LQANDVSSARIIALAPQTYIYIYEVFGWGRDIYMTKPRINSGVCIQKA